MMRLRYLLLVGWMGLLLGGCGDGPKAKFVDRGIPKPVDPETVPVCNPQTGSATIHDQGERTVKVVHDGVDQQLQTYFANGTACVARSIHDVWSVLKTGPGVQWTDSTLTAFSPLQPPQAGMDFSWVASQEAGDIIRPSWDILWNHRVVEGTAAEPIRLQVQFLKNQGTRFIRHWRGEIVLEKLNPRETGVRMEIELRGARITVENCTKAITTQVGRLQSLPANE